MAKHLNTLPIWVQAELCSSLIWATIMPSLHSASNWLNDLCLLDDQLFHLYTLTWGFYRLALEISNHLSFKKLKFKNLKSIYLFWVITLKLWVASTPYWSSPNFFNFTFWFSTRINWEKFSNDLSLRCVDVQQNGISLWKKVFFWIVILEYLHMVNLY